MADTFLVTGAGGFIGGAMAYRLALEGQRVVAAFRDKPGSWTGNLGSDAVATGRTAMAFGDVTDEAFIRRILIEYDVSIVFHLAAMSKVSKCQQNPVEAWRSNVIGMVSVLEACRRWHGMRRGGMTAIVVASTDKVYGDGPTPYKEAQVLLGRDPYAASKVAADVAARSYAYTYGLPIRVVRSCNVYGPGDSDETRLIPGSIIRMMRGEPAILHSGAAEMIREFVYIDDELNAYQTVARSGGNGEVYNVSGGGPVRVGDIMRQLAAACGGRYVVVDKDFKEIGEQWMDGTRLLALGWSPKVSMAEGVVRTADWLRSMRRDEQYPRLVAERYG